MELYWKGTALVLICAVLYLVVSRQEKDLGLLMMIGACCLTASMAAAYLEPVLDLLWDLGNLANMESQTMGILMKILGAALTTELGVMLCQDAGAGSLGKMLQMLGSCAILCLSVPLFRTLLTLMGDILGEL